MKLKMLVAGLVVCSGMNAWANTCSDLVSMITPEVLRPSLGCERNPDRTTACSALLSFANTVPSTITCRNETSVCSTLAQQISGAGSIEGNRADGLVNCFLSTDYKGTISGRDQVTDRDRVVATLRAVVTSGNVSIVNSISQFEACRQARSGGDYTARLQCIERVLGQGTGISAEIIAQCHLSTRGRDLSAVGRDERFSYCLDIAQNNSETLASDISECARDNNVDYTCVLENIVERYRATVTGS